MSAFGAQLVPPALARLFRAKPSQNGAGSYRTGSGLVERLSHKAIDDMVPAEAPDAVCFAFVPQARPAPAKVFVECVDLSVLARHRLAWADLSARTLDPNVFLSPSFALPLLQHVCRHDRLKFLLVWEDSGPASFERLIGLFPLQVPHVPLSVWPARVFSHEQTASGTPLVDGERAPAVFEAVMGWLGSQGGRSAALVFRNVSRDDPFGIALRRFCAETSRRIEVLAQWDRAVLPRVEGAERAIVAFASGKRRKERKRQAARLSESGLRTYTSARSPAEAAAAIERFLALEHKGWKGARGTSLLSDPRTATFARTMTRLMAADGRCRIDSIEIDGRPVAMGIVLRDADRAYFWKTTFDESYASLSPGVQLVIELTGLQQKDQSLTLTDSCAVAGHPMIDRIWPRRAAMADLMVATRTGRSRRFEHSLRLERGFRRARRHIKSWLETWRHRRGN